MGAVESQARIEHKTVYRYRDFSVSSVLLDIDGIGRVLVGIPVCIPIGRWIGMVSEIGTLIYGPKKYLLKTFRISLLVISFHLILRT